MITDRRRRRLRRAAVLVAIPPGMITDRYGRATRPAVGEHVAIPPGMITDLRRELPRLHDDPVAIPPGMITDSRTPATLPRPSGCDPSTDDHRPEDPAVQPDTRPPRCARPPERNTAQDRQVPLDCI